MEACAMASIAGSNHCKQHFSCIKNSAFCNLKTERGAAASSESTNTVFPEEDRLNVVNEWRAITWFTELKLQLELSEGHDNWYKGKVACC